MSILTNKVSREIKFECDSCGEIFASGSTDLMEALRNSEEAGWSQSQTTQPLAPFAPKRRAKVWLHHCSQKCRHEWERQAA